MANSQPGTSYYSLPDCSEAILIEKSPSQPRLKNGNKWGRRSAEPSLSRGPDRPISSSTRKHPHEKATNTKQLAQVQPQLLGDLPHPLHGLTDVKMLSNTSRKRLPLHVNASILRLGGIIKFCIE